VGLGGHTIVDLVVPALQLVLGDTVCLGDGVALVTGLDLVEGIAVVCNARHLGFIGGGWLGGSACWRLGGSSHSGRGRRRRRRRRRDCGRGGGCFRIVSDSADHAVRFACIEIWTGDRGVQLFEIVDRQPPCVCEALACGACISRCGKIAVHLPTEMEGCC